MSNLEITLNAETSFEFELNVKGIDIGGAMVRFGLEKNGITFQFPCKQKSGKWNVVVPPLNRYGLKEGLYQHTIELIANGYYFAPIKGTAEVKPAAEVSGALVKKDVKVSVSGIKVTEKKISTKKPLNEKKKVSTKKPLNEKEYQRKYAGPSKLARLQELAGIKK